MSILQPFYDREFMDSGCNATLVGGEEGIDLTTVDNTIGTWVTNYAILAVGLLGVFQFKCMKTPKVTYKRFLFTSGYFGFTGLGYGLAGVNHQLRQLKTDPDFSWVAYVFTTLGALSLNYQIAMNFKGSGNPKQWYTKLTLFIGLAVIVVLIGWRSMSVAGNYLIASHLWFAIYYVALLRDWMASVGSALNVIGLVVQVLLAPTCGDSAYAVCFENCILPDPTNFNHNGVFHVIVILGLLVQLFAEFVPTESETEEEQEQQEKHEGTPLLFSNP